MNPKYFTLKWWAFSLWFLVFGLWSLIAITTSLFSWLNSLLAIFGLTFMVYCAIQEEKWFPTSEVKPE